MNLPDHLSLDLDSLTLGDLEAMEEALGTLPADFSEAGLKAAGVGRSKMVVALALVALRRLDPAATLADARRLPVDALETKGDAAEVPPTEGP